MAKTMTFYDVQGLNRALRGLSKAASVTLRDASQDIAGQVASTAASSAGSQGGVAALVSPTIRAGRDRVPVVKMGGSRKLRSGTIGDVIWGAEFGGQRRPTTQQFRPWRGSDSGAGYFLWPAVRANRSYIEKAYGDALLEAIDKSAT